MMPRRAAAERFADTLSRLRSSRGVAQRLLSLTAGADFSLAEVAALIETDPALAARVLRVVNSARYGLRHQVGGVRQAAALLGQRSLRMLAVSFSLTDGLTGGPAAPLAAGHARRAVLLASSAARLARLNRGSAGPGPSPDEAYTAGLLADVGVLILAQYQPQLYLPAHADHPHGPALIAAEQELFDIAHPELGARFLGRWGLPEAVTTAVAVHHEATDNSGGPLGTILRTAEQVAAAAGSDGEADTAALRSDFGVSAPGTLIDQVRADLAETGNLFAAPLTAV